VLSCSLTMASRRRLFRRVLMPLSELPRYSTSNLLCSACFPVLAAMQSETNDRNTWPTRAIGQRRTGNGPRRHKRGGIGVRLELGWDGMLWGQLRCVELCLGGRGRKRVLTSDARSRRRRDTTTQWARWAPMWMADNGMMCLMEPG